MAVVVIKIYSFDSYYIVTYRPSVYSLTYRNHLLLLLLLLLLLTLLLITILFLIRALYKDCNFNFMHTSRFLHLP